MLQTSDHKVLDLNPAGGGIQVMTVWCFVAQSLHITLPLSQYDLNNVERDITNCHHFIPT